MWIYVAHIVLRKTSNAPIIPAICITRPTAQTYHTRLNPIQTVGYLIYLLYQQG